MFHPYILATFYVGSLGRMLTLQGSSLTRNFAVFFRRCFTPEVHTRTDDHAAQSYSSASFKSASSLSHCKNSAVVSLTNLVTAGYSLLRHSHNLPLFNSSHCFEQDSTTRFHSFYCCDHTTRLGSASLLCPPFKWLDMCLPPVVKSSSQQSWCDTHALRMVLRLVSLGYTPLSLAFWPLLGFETSCHGCSSYIAQSRIPVPSPFVCLTDWECSCTWGSKLRTIFLLEAFDGRGRSLQSGGAYDSRAARQRGQESDTQCTDRNNVIVYSVL